MLFKVPEMLNPNPPVRAYFLRIEIYTGQELPGSEGLLHFSIGPYFKKTKLMKSNHGIFDWEKECVEFNRLMLPIDASQIPDLFIYFADADYESHRKCYFRLKTHMILNRSRKQYAKKFERPVLVKFKEDISLDLVPDDQFSGFVILRPVLFSYEPIEREKPEVLQYGLQKIKGISSTHELRMFFYVGRDLPTASDSGTCNPLIVIRVADKVIYSRIKRNTINPEWYHVETVEINAPNTNDKGAPPLAIVVMLFHVDDPDVHPEKYFETDIDQMNEKNDNDESENKGMFPTFIPKKKVLLGRYWLELDLNKKKIYKNPKTGKE